MTYNFDEEIDRRGSDCIKYDLLKERYGRDDLDPLWVADMDFRTPDFIVDALKKRCEHPVFGYSYLSDDYYTGIINWTYKLHNWKVRREWLCFVPGIVRGIAYAVEYLSSPGDKVIIQPPVYHPFRIVPEKLGREVVNNPLKLVDGEYEMDFEQLKTVIDDKCKVLILSNPHNPAGIVWKKETLQQLASICAGHNIVVISDEIHSEMAHPPFTHHPFPTVSDEAAACGITFSAPSKTFNIAGIIASYAIVPDERLRKGFYSYLEAGEFNEGSLFSYVATVAAYKHGDEWRRQMLDYVRRNVLFVDDYLKQNIPQIKAYMPQASFLLWLDCRGLGLSQRELNDMVTAGAHLALSDGSIFGKEGEGYMRINVGCPRLYLEKAMESLKKSVEFLK
ncbi:MAG: PatB family C-S lyase [Tannerella sp.]|jgi:cystathionine beta-lyase|nr:PatB family C-S lyase [Tannerella sp.]